MTTFLCLIGYGRLRPYLTIVIGLLFLHNSSHGQMRVEAGVTVGPSNILGDLGGRYGRGMTFVKDNNIEMTRIMSGAYVSFAPTPHLVFRAAINVGRLEGADSIIAAKGGHELTRMERNLHFRSPLAEAFLAAEVYPTVWLEGNPTETIRKIRPYFLIGMGLFRFNPQAQYTDINGASTWVDLQPLRTEGQGMAAFPDRKEYKLTQINVPYGIGLRYFFSESFYLGMEIVNRITFTDYIDDVSNTYIPDHHFYDHFGTSSFEAELAAKMANHSNLTIRANTRSGFQGNELRGDNKENDSYYSMNLRIGIRLRGIQPSGSPRRFVRYKRRTGQTRCPHVVIW